MGRPNILTSQSSCAPSILTRSASRAFVLLPTGWDDSQSITALLEFFGIPWDALTPSDLAVWSRVAGNDKGAGYCIVSSAACMAEALLSAREPENAAPAWLESASSVYIYGFRQAPACRELLRRLTGAPEAEVRPFDWAESRVVVASDWEDLGGPMSGIEATVPVTGDDGFFDLPSHSKISQGIITADGREVFVSVVYQGVRLFLNACSRIIDIDAPATKYFDVKEHLFSAVPIAMYLKWAFADVCWSGTETRGCLIVDDPLLKPRYGFLRFRETLELMDSHHFTTSIAFIPWNWRRTNRWTVRQFQVRRDVLSLCVHGCDHTSSEFAARSTGLLNKRIKIANRRMDMLCRRAALQHDPIMVFPQGSFSPEVGRALKLNGFVAAANTEVCPSGGAPNDTTISDLWDVAIMKYGTFPIFTRRYLTHGIENFAFDALLGKPCLMVAHHEVFRSHGRELMDFITKLNSLRWNLRWCSLGEVISHSCKVRNTGGTNRAIQMYAGNLVLENRSSETETAVVIKPEGDPDCVKAVMVNERTIDHTCKDQHLEFPVVVPPGERTTVSIAYFDRLELDSSRDGMAYKLKTMARRHLSEIRDNYVSRNDLLYATAVKLKRLVK
jgi:hypothetical protein